MIANASPPVQAEPPLTRDRLSSVALIIVTAIGVVLCLAVTAPFVPALTWAVALAVLANPVHKWVRRKVSNRDVAAGLALAIVVVAIGLPTFLLGRRLVAQSADQLEKFQQQVRSGELEATIRQHPRLAGAYDWVSRTVGQKEALQNVAQGLQTRVGRWLRTAAFGVVQFLIALFVLFFLFRDRKEAVEAARWILPLSKKEADDVIARVHDMVYATLYGTFVVAAIQGALGGLMFWILGLPAPLFAGLLMALLSLIPSSGTFFIWLPAAGALASQGEAGKAILLGVWGLLVVSSVDNLLFPVLVGQRMRMHTVPVFLATIGGLFLFGAAGIILGPVAFAFTLALLDVLRKRTEGHRSAQQPT
ncbi:MAG: AI-2E family transporter [Bryobacterales bacterium]|nr:AI-2E family transporter [Bryobacterales bacterium]